MLDPIKVVFITEAGRAMYEALYQKKLEHIERLSRSAESIDARSVGSSSFGGPLADPLTEELEWLRRQADELLMLSRKPVAPAPTQKHVVEIGNGIWLRYKHKVEKKAREVYRPFIVVGHGEGDCGSHPRRVAYNSELIKPFMGAQKGYSEIGWLDGRARTLLLTSIFIPK